MNCSSCPMDDSLPLEISEACESFHLSLAEIESLLRETPYDAVDHESNTLTNVKLKLMTSYSLTSLFWVYLLIKGVPVQNLPIKKELERIQKLMEQMKQYSAEEQSIPAESRINKGAAKRIVRNALWDSAS